MTVTVTGVQKEALGALMASSPHVSLSTSDLEVFNRCLRSTVHVYVGFKDDALVGVWGLCPPTLLAEEAYLWLYTTPALKGNEFLFVRHSQIQMKQMLERYPVIVGETKLNADSSIRWLQWLGAEFGQINKGRLPFVIRKK